jgi:hypothetical protein
MIYIPVSADKLMVVDDDDDVLDIVIGRAWTLDRYGYVRMRRLGKSLYIHNLVLGNKSRCDHINRDRLDNRRANLRPVTLRANRLNAEKNSNNTSGFRGVTAKGNKWQAQTKISNKSKYLGLFESKEDAATAYNFAVFDPLDPFIQLNTVSQPWLEEQL